MWDDYNKLLVRSLPRGGGLRIVESSNSCVVGPSQWAVKHSLACHECFFV